MLFRSLTCVTRRLLAILAVALVAAGCSGSDDPDPPSASVAPTPTTERTTSTTEALTPEEEVEAAYLKSWDVYAKAMRELDPAGLDEAFAGEALELRRQEVADLKAAGTPAEMRVEHNIAAIRVDGDRASVLDNFINHSVTVDPSTGKPTEEDPNEPYSQTYSLERGETGWLVTFVQRHSL